MFTDTRTALDNAAIRCTVLSNYDSDDVLYNIFYRLNTGSVPLSTQELRQVITKGPMSEYMVQVTNQTHPIHQYLGLEEPDPRFRDVELLLRFIGLQLFADRYDGNLKRFLDLTLYNSNTKWGNLKPDIEQLNASLTASTSLVNQMLGSAKHVGKRWADHRWEGRFNKAIFDVELFYAHHLVAKKPKAPSIKTFAKALQHLFESDDSFTRSIEVTTKSREQYYARFSAYEALVNKHFKTKFGFSKQFVPR